MSKVPLPVCCNRGPEVRNGRIACRSDRLIPEGTKWINAAETCPICPYADVPNRVVHRPVFRGVQPLPPPAVSPNRTLPCVFEGPIVQWCSACNPVSADARHVRDCAVHGRCSRNHPNPQDDVQVCVRCDDYALVDPASFSTRHLLYHVYPVAGNGVWQRNLDALIARLALFNGRRVIAIATDGADGPIPFRDGSGPAPDGARVALTSDPPEAVEERLDGLGFEAVRVTNDPNLREVATFRPLFDRVSGCVGPTDVTLYAHSKATTRDLGHLAHEWTDLLHEAMLDYWPAVARVLSRHPLAGCFLKRGRGWRAEQSRSDWHYSGSWFWFRNADLFGKPDWPTIDQFWSGIEPYPSQHFAHGDAGVVFHEGQVPAVNLYSGRYWDRVVRPAWAKWKAEHAGKKSAVRV